MKSLSTVNIHAPINTLAAAVRNRFWLALSILGLTATLLAASPARADGAPEQEIECLALAIYFEARGESGDGQEAVAVGAVAALPEVRQALLSQMNDVVVDTPEAFAKVIGIEAAKWGEIGRKLGVKLN